jgi:membrane protein required for colicin V production
MSTLDIIVLIVAGLYVAKGFYKGFLIEAFSLLGFFLAIICAIKWSHDLLPMFPDSWGNSVLFNFIAYLLVFLIVFVAVQFLGRLIEKFVKLIQLNLINRISGAVFAFLQAVFIVSLIFWLSDQVNLISEESKENSFTYNACSGVAPKVIDYSTENFSSFAGVIAKVEETFSKVKISQTTPEHDIVN